MSEIHANPDTVFEICLGDVAHFAALCKERDTHPSYDGYRAYSPLIGFADHSTISSRVSKNWHEVLKACGVNLEDFNQNKLFPSTKLKQVFEKCVLDVTAFIKHCKKNNLSPSQECYQELCPSEGWESVNTVEGLISRNWNDVLKFCGYEPKKYGTLEKCKDHITAFVKYCNSEHVFPSRALYKKISHENGWTYIETLEGHISKDWNNILQIGGYDNNLSQSEYKALECFGDVCDFVQWCKAHNLEPLRDLYQINSTINGWASWSAIKIHIPHEWKEIIKAAADNPIVSQQNNSGEIRPESVRIDKKDLERIVLALKKLSTELEEYVDFNI